MALIQVSEILWFTQIYRWMQKISWSMLSEAPRGPSRPSSRLVEDWLGFGELILTGCYGKWAIHRCFMMSYLSWKWLQFGRLPIFSWFMMIFPNIENGWKWQDVEFHVTFRRVRGSRQKVRQSVQVTVRKMGMGHQPDTFHPWVSTLKAPQRCHDGDGFCLTPQLQVGT